MNKKLLNNLVCPQCRHQVQLNKSAQSVDCDICQLGFPIHDEIPVMLLEEALPLVSESI